MDNHKNCSLRLRCLTLMLGEVVVLLHLVVQEVVVVVAVEDLKLLMEPPENKKLFQLLSLNELRWKFLLCFSSLLIWCGC